MIISNNVRTINSVYVNTVTLLARMTALRAAYLDNLNNAQLLNIPDLSAFTPTVQGRLDATISSRAPASTAINNLILNDARIGFLDNLCYLTDARKGYMDNINNAQLLNIPNLSTLTPTVIGRIDATVSSRSTLTQAQIVGDSTAFNGASIAKILNVSNVTQLFMPWLGIDSGDIMLFQGHNYWEYTASTKVYDLTRFTGVKIRLITSENMKYYTYKTLVSSPWPSIGLQFSGDNTNWVDAATLDSATGVYDSTDGTTYSYLSYYADVNQNATGLWVRFKYNNNGYDAQIRACRLVISAYNNPIRMLLELQSQ